jgi:hypothetical protein
MEMVPVFSRDAMVVAWLKNDVVYDLRGEPRAIVRGTAVISYEGVYLGRTDRGFFRDPQGDAVAFMPGATNGPITPSPRVKPAPPPTRDVLITPNVRIVAKPGPASVFWSTLDWEGFLTQEPEPEPIPEGPPELAI